MPQCFAGRIPLQGFNTGHLPDSLQSIYLYSTFFDPLLNQQGKNAYLCIVEEEREAQSRSIVRVHQCLLNRNKSDP